jgi:hypothetical protein
LERDDFDVLEGGVTVGRIYRRAGAPEHLRWFWASGHNGGMSRVAHGHEATREAAMAAFAKRWRSECKY